MRLHPSHRRTIVVGLTGWLLMGLQAQFNHYLAPHGVSLTLGGLFISFGALRLAPQQGFTASFLLGLLIDATQPVPFGLNAFLFGSAHLVVLRVRERFAVQETSVALTTALIINLALFVVHTFIMIGRTDLATVSGLRVFTDLLASQCCLALIAPWFFALQQRSLDIARVGLQDRPTQPI